MKILNDVFGRSVRLTGERLGHILEHPEMIEMEPEIAKVLQEPKSVRRSLSDESSLLFYGWFGNTPVGSKWMCIVVKYVGMDAFIVTAYLTDKIKNGEDVWRGL